MAQFTPKNREEWRRWLAKHHASAPEVWLVFFKQGSARPTLSYKDAVEEALCFGWIDGVRRRLDEERYAHRFSPRREGSKWSAINKERAERMRKEGLMAPAGESAVKEAKTSGAWAGARKKSATRTRFDMPADFAARLARDKNAAAFFQSLAPSYQQRYLGWIGIAKRPETRARRIDEAMRLLRKGEKLCMV
jgi:uncharacterized protein YdeI (YjbR/CyaY-like superfamily)